MDRHVVVVAADGPDALAKLRADGSIDLLISDVQMPSIDGITLAARAERIRAGIRVLLMSGFAVDQARIQSTPARIVGLLTKPFTLDAMRAAAAKALL
jgi:two-component system cell cycle sensor histidine kinase/response regulator CckA